MVNKLFLLYFKTFELYDRYFKKLKPIMWQKKPIHYLEGEDKFTFEKALFLKYLGSYKSAIVFIWDDLCPKNGKNSILDNGGISSSNLKYLDSLNKRFPFMKSTLFSIPNVSFEGCGYYSSDWISNNKFDIRNVEYEFWIKKISSKQFQKNNEISLHGLHHFQKEKKYWPQMEYEFKTKDKCLNSIMEGKSIFKEININVTGFCPPVFGIGYNSNFGLIEALKECNFDYVCLGTKNSGVNLFNKNVSCVYPSYYQSLLNMPQNLSLTLSFEDLKKNIDDIVKLNGLIVIKGHFVQNWRLGDGWNDEIYKKIVKVIEYLENKYFNKVKYVTFGDIGKWYKKQ